MTTTGTRRLGRPTAEQSAELEEQLRLAALQLFLDRGFDATTMDAVARAAGITRRTLYARHPDKHQLFVDVITWARTRSPWVEPDFSVDITDLAPALTAIARAAIDRAIDPEVVRLERVVLTEWRRFPDLVMYGRSRPSRRAELVEDVLRHHHDAGTIEVTDLEIAAEQFLAMVSMMPARLAAVGVRRPRDVEDRHIAHAVRVFIRGLRPSQ